jgi:hypothetical protein
MRIKEREEVQAKVIGNIFKKIISGHFQISRKDAWSGTGSH